MKRTADRRSSQKPLPRSFYARDVVEVARELLGKHLIRTGPDGVTVGRIVEVEAYLASGDSAAHSYRGKTPRNASKFGPAGHAYVYAIHARFCLNAVTEFPDVPSAVLIRALEPVEGLELMGRRRNTHAPRLLTRGPARLCEAFAVDKELDGWDLTRGQGLWVAEGPTGKIAISQTPRVGVTSAEDLLLRFIDSESPYISRPRMRA